MIVDRKWVKRNIGFDPIARPAPVSTFAFQAAASSSQSEDLQREIIDFDSDGPEGREFLAFTTTTGLSRFTDISWPKGSQPKTDKTARKGKNGALPAAEVLVVTWTVDEGHALSRVLTPGKDSRNDYVPYTHNYDQISKKMRAGCPARIAKRLGSYWTGTIGKKSIVFFKSDSHMSQDGPELPNIDVWTQIIAEVKPQLVITTGTAGGIGPHFEVGDVIVSPIVRFDCIQKFKGEAFHDSNYSSTAVRTSLFAKAKELFAANADQLPKDNTRAPEILETKIGNLKASVMTTDFFGFDTSNNHFKLQGLGNVSEMGDAVLGLVSQGMEDQGQTVPRWIAVRNVSDPQIKAEGTIKQQAAIAAQIYKAYGRWSSVCSAIVCWALIAAEK
jgi:nucleoside phosphorylase